MLVYGDAVDMLAVHDEFARIGAALTASATEPAGERRASRLLDLFVDAGALAQGLIDVDFARAGHDRTTPGSERLGAWLIALARLILPPTAPDRPGQPEASRSALRATVALAEQPWPRTVAAKRAEGFAHYALFPEAYAVAATEVDRTAGPPTVIGLRSIGLPLAAVVAAATGAATFLSVRPIGPPFDRRLALALDLERQMVGHPAAPVLVVDEGPGLSGSSFGAVADRLEALGVDRRRVVFLPGHAGEPGPEASPRHRRRWAGTRRLVCDFDRLFLGPDRRLEVIAAAALGRPARLVADLSGGGWRGHLPGRAAVVADPARERRKLLFETADGPVLAKFGGLGRPALAAAARQSRLAEAGFVPPVLGRADGFVFDRWCADARPLDPFGPDRPRFLARLGDYLGFRAAAFPAPDAVGASLATLAEMLRINAAGGLGLDCDRRAAATALEPRVRPVHTDGRLHAREWLCLPDGRILKTDAVDHDRSHDLIGPQDIAWDVAGATVEFALIPTEIDALAARIAAVAGRPVDRDVVAFLAPCYAAFQLGLSTFARAAAGSDPAELARIEAEISRYGKVLAAIAGVRGSPADREQASHLSR